MIVHQQVEIKLHPTMDKWLNYCTPGRIYDCTPSGRNLIAPNYGKIIKSLYSRENPMIVHHQVEI